MTTPNTEPDFVEAELEKQRPPLERMVRGWDRFFFKPADPTTLGMIRICCGLIALYTLVAWAIDLQDFFGEHAWVDLEARNEWRQNVPVYQNPFEWIMTPGISPDWKESKEDEEYVKRWDVHPGQLYSRGTPIWSIWFHVTDPGAMVAVHAAIMLIVFLFTIGFCTRVTSVLTWFGMLSYIHRSPTTVFGVDTMMTIALLYLMIGPSGAALSVDRLIKRWWLTRRALRQARLAREEGSGSGAVHIPPLPVQPQVSANLAMRLFQIHVCIIYLAAGLSKLQGRSWWTGEAIWGTLANYEFAPMQYPFYKSFLVFLSEHRLFWEIFMTAGTVFTLAFEIGFAFLVWNRHTRWVIIAMAVTLHGGIGLFMGLKTFSLMMLTLVMSFVPPEVMRRWLRAVSWGPRGMRLYFPLAVPRATRAAAVIHALDVWNQVELVEQQAAGRKTPEPARMDKRGNGLVLRAAEGKEYTGRRLYWHLFVSLGIFRTFSPWCWLVAPFRRRPAQEATAPLRLQEVVAEPVSLRPGGEVLKTNMPHVKQLKQKH
jgi:hypothetical protein